MEKTAGRVLKGSDVKFEGSVQLDAAQLKPSAQNAASAMPQARIIQNNPEFALIEVTCPCGTRTSLKCEYAVTQSPNQTQEQTK